MKSFLPSLDIKGSIEKLYVPTLIVSNEKELDFTKSSTLPLERNTGASMAENMALFNAVTKASLSSTILASTAIVSLEINFLILDFINRITGRKKLNEAKKYMLNLHDRLMQNHMAYAKSHKDYALDIIYDINIINQVKHLLKEIVLTEVSKKLLEMGIDNKIGDYQIEQLNEEMLQLNKGIEEIIVEIERLEKMVKILDSTFVTMLFSASPIVSIFYNRRLAKEINDKVTEFEKESKLENEKIEADLIRIGMFEKALTNVMSIFNDIANNLIPLIMSIIEDIEHKYHNHYYEIPSPVLMALHTSCKIMKGMAEKNILGNKSEQATQNDVIKYSNELSKEYIQIKEEILKIA